MKNFKPVLFCLLSLSSTALAQDFTRNVLIFTDSVSCEEGIQIAKEAHQRFKDVGINPRFKLYCVDNYVQPFYELGQSHVQLRHLSAKFKGDNHFIVSPFSGTHFDGVAIRKDSLSVAKPARVLDASEQAAHEVAHTKDATHDLTNCNIMGYRRCGYPASFNEKAIKEMK